MDPDRFPGSRELIEAIRLEGGAALEGPVPVSRLAKRLPWRPRELECALNLFARAGLVTWAPRSEVIQAPAIHVVGVIFSTVAACGPECGAGGEIHPMQEAAP